VKGFQGGKKDTTLSTQTQGDRKLDGFCGEEHPTQGLYGLYINITVLKDIRHSR
jgi:hypothetical protein